MLGTDIHGRRGGQGGETRKGLGQTRNRICPEPSVAEGVGSDETLVMCFYTASQHRVLDKSSQFITRRHLGRLLEGEVLPWWLIQGGSKALDDEAEHSSAPTDKRTQANRDRRLAKKKRLAADREELQRHRTSAASSAKGTGQGKSKGKGKSKDQAGMELCFSWASGQGPCGRRRVKISCKETSHMQVVPFSVPLGC